MGKKLSWVLGAVAFLACGGTADWQRKDVEVPEVTGSTGINLNAPRCTLDRDSLWHYMSLMYVPGTDTIVRGIKRLGPGECLTYRLGESRNKTENDLTPWLGARAQAGRLAPTSLARNKRFT